MVEGKNLSSQGGDEGRVEKKFYAPTRTEGTTTADEQAEIGKRLEEEGYTAVIHTSINSNDSQQYDELNRIIGEAERAGKKTVLVSSPHEIGQTLYLEQ